MCPNYFRSTLHTCLVTVHVHSVNKSTTIISFKIRQSISGLPHSSLVFRFLNQVNIVRKGLRYHALTYASLCKRPVEARFQSLGFANGKLPPDYVIRYICSPWHAKYLHKVFCVVIWFDIPFIQVVSDNTILSHEGRNGPPLANNLWNSS
jgi:hypothetical protein